MEKTDVELMQHALRIAKTFFLGQPGTGDDVDDGFYEREILPAFDAVDHLL